MFVWRKRSGKAGKKKEYYQTKLQDKIDKIKCYLEVRVGTISWETACHLGRLAVGHHHSKHQTGGPPGKPQGQRLPLRFVGPSVTACVTKR